MSAAGALTCVSSNRCPVAAGAARPGADLIRCATSLRHAASWRTIPRSSWRPRRSRRPAGATSGVAGRTATRRASRGAVEGSGSYGSGACAHLGAAREQVIEFSHPRTAATSDGAKTDALDARRAAREVLGRPDLAVPRARGRREALRALTRRGATARTAASTTALTFSALRGLTTAAQVAMRRVGVHWQTGPAQSPGDQALVQTSIRGLSKFTNPRNRSPTSGSPARRRTHHRRTQSPSKSARLAGAPLILVTHHDRTAPTPVPATLNPTNTRRADFLISAVVPDSWYATHVISCATELAIVTVCAAGTCVLYHDLSGEIA